MISEAEPHVRGHHKYLAGFYCAWAVAVDEFLLWYDAQPQGRYELVAGEIVAQAAERARHNLVKRAITRALEDAVLNKNLQCTVFADGMGVRIDEHHWREPDAAVQCGVSIYADALMMESPVIVVEVLSPSSLASDTGEKLAEYFSLRSARHYLIVNTNRSVIIHHAKDNAGRIDRHRHGRIFDPESYRSNARYDAHLCCLRGIGGSRAPVV